MIDLSLDERAMAYMCIQHILSGEWPFRRDESGAPLAALQMTRSRDLARSVAEKLWGERK